jgi:hypothetical protein
MRRTLAIAIAATVIATPAYAHGEDVLVSIYAQGVTVVAATFLLLTIPTFRHHRLCGAVGCIVGLAVSWLMTDDMPYRANHVLITSIGIVSPLSFAGLAVLAANRYAAYRRRPNKSLERTREK